MSYLKKGQDVLSAHGPPDDIVCKDCAFRLPPAKFVGERHTFAKCAMYEDKPRAILWEHGKCEFHKKGS